jgi:hypothetical protein
MSSLEGKTIATTYKDLLQVSNNNIGIDGVIRSVEDGEGTASALSLSTDTIEIHGNILPHTNSTYDIGSADKKIRHLYLSDNSLYIGDLQFSNVDLQEVKNLRSGAFATSVQGALAESAIQPGSFSFSDLNERPTTLAGFGIVDAATAAQGDKASSAIQPGDSIPFSVIDAKPTSLAGYGIVDGANSIQGERADSALQPGDMIHVNTIHLSGGVIYGPPVMYIDPTGIGDNTGKVCIMGDLQIDGTTTTVNSTTLSVSGKTINLSEGATSASESDGAGVVVTGGDASMIYKSVPDQWSFNKSVDVRGWINAQADALSADAVINLVASNDDSYTAISRIKSISESDSNASSSLTFSTRDSANDISENMRIDSAGNVGIGTTNPDSKLTIGGVNNPEIKLISAFNNELADASIRINEAGSVAIHADPSNNSATYLTNFHITVDGSEHMRINSAGNVGIGTTNPGTALEINKEIGESSPIITLSRGGTSKSRFAIANATSSILDGAVTDDLCIRTEGGNIRFGTASATKTDMSILSNGNVGIGTTSPDYKLDISTNSTTGLRLINHTTPGVNESNDPPAILFQAKGWDTDVGSRPYSARIRVNSNYSGAPDRGNSHPVMNFDLETNENDPDDTLSTKMMINADGNVGIGTTSPVSYTGFMGSSATTTTINSNNGVALNLQRGTDINNTGIGAIQFLNTNNSSVTGMGSGSQLLGLISIQNVTSDENTHDDAGGNMRLYTKEEAGSVLERMRIDSAGNVGIGTTNPKAELHIESNIANHNTTLKIENRHGDSGGTAIEFQGYRDVSDDHWVAKIVADHVNSTAHGSAAIGSKLNFHTYDGLAGYINPKMTIDQGGNVGIGTTNPVGKLEVSDSVNGGATAIRIINRYVAADSTDETSDLEFWSATNTDTHQIAKISAYKGGDYYSANDELHGGLTFWTQSSVLQPTTNGYGERMRITSAGNVGIGTTSPVGKLELDNGTSAVDLQFKETSTNFHRLGIKKEGPLLQLGEFNNAGDAFTNILTVDAEHDYVGIGTTDPSGKLNIHTSTAWGSAINEALTISNIGLEGNVSSAHNLGRIRWTTNTNDAAAIDAIRTSPQHGNATDLAFSTNTGGSNDTTTEVMRLNSAGNVGIGTTNPLSRLHVTLNNGQDGSIKAGGDAQSLGLMLEYDQAGDTESTITSNKNVTSNPGALLKIRTCSDVNPNQLVLNGAGNVGIGTANPGSTLSVYRANSGAPDATFASIEVVTKNTDTVANLKTGWLTQIGCYSLMAANGVGVGNNALIGVHRESAGSNEAAILRLSRSGHNAENYFWVDASGLFRTSSSSADAGSTSGTVVGTQSSDERIKNIEDSFEYGLNDVLKLKPIAFTFREQKDDSRKLGFGAQSVQPIIPESVFDSNECIDGYDLDPEDESHTRQIPKSDKTKLVMEYTQLIPVLTKAIQQQQTIIEDLKARIETLENK